MSGIYLILNFYNSIKHQLERYEEQLKCAFQQDSSGSDWSSSCNEQSVPGCSSRPSSHSSGDSTHSRSRRHSPQHLHRLRRTTSRTSFHEASPYPFPKELSVSPMPLPLEHLHCSQSTHSYEKPYYLAPRISPPDAVSGKNETTERPVVPIAPCQAETVARRDTSTCHEVRLPRKSPRRLWQFAILIVQIMVMLLPARLRYAQKVSIVKTTTKVLKVASILASAGPPVTIKPTSQMAKVSLNSQVFLQKLELHLRCKLSEQLWGFPKLVIKYAGEQVVHLRLSGRSGDRRAKQGEGKAEVSKLQPGDRLKKLHHRYPMALDDLDVPNTSLIIQQAEHSEILRNPEAPYRARQDDHLGIKIHTKKECNLGMRLETKRDMKQLEAHIRRRHRLANRHTFHSRSRHPHILTISAIVSTQTTQPDSEKKGPPLKGRQAIMFMNQFSLIQIEQNLTLKRENHLQGKQTPYTLSLEEMAATSTQDNFCVQNENEGRTSGSWFSRTPP